MNPDPYADTQGVLINLLGITDPELLRQAEADLSFAAMLRLAEQPLPGNYDLAHLQGFHRALFAAVYPWAGQIRTVRMARTEHDMFCFPQFIDAAAADVFGQLARDNQLRGLGREAFITRVAYFYAEVNAIHPFREGNGRTQRAFFGQLAHDAGWRIAWADLRADVNDRASAAGLHGDTHLLVEMFDALVVARPGAR